VGDANCRKLWIGLSQQLLQRRRVIWQRANRGRNLQGIQRYSGLMGIEPHHEPAVRANVAANFFGDQWDLQLGQAAA
jgi:hypothetical protein